MKNYGFEKIKTLLVSCIYFIVPFSEAFSQQDSAIINIDWNNTIAISKTTPTLQLVENPMVRPGSPIHKAVFESLKNLQADYVRYVPWFPYPKMAVAELKPPTGTETFWDFTYLDSTMESFMNATQGHSVVINFSTTPAWLWETDAEVKYPEDPYQVFWDYNAGRKLRDTSFKEISDYYARLFSWYTQGGFTDELGKYHRSNHHYTIQYWEVLNEPDLEHDIPVETYTKIYDAIVSKLKKISPATKFLGISLARVARPEYFEYFLNPRNHKPGIPLDGITYHFYAVPSGSRQGINDYQYTYFDRAEGFLDKVSYIENIRQRLSPKTITMINELGTMCNYTTGDDIPNEYWSLSGALYAYVYVRLAQMGIDVAGESQLVGYPSQFPDVSMVNWNTGEPNTRYRVLKLMIAQLGKNDKLISTSSTNGDITAQAFDTKKGKKILLINTKNRTISVQFPQQKNSKLRYLQADPASTAIPLDHYSITIKPFEVGIVEIL